MTLGSSVRTCLPAISSTVVASRTTSIARPVLFAAALNLNVTPIQTIPRVRGIVSTHPRYKEQASRSAWAKNPIIGYDEVKKLSQQPNDDVLLIDVREPDEVALGSIPSSVNLPLSRLREALDSQFNPGDFQKEFAFPKPRSSQNIVFFCRSGKRAASAGEWAGQHGYHNVRNYEGSYLDWTAKEKKNGNSEDD